MRNIRRTKSKALELEKAKGEGQYWRAEIHKYLDTNQGGTRQLYNGLVKLMMVHVVDEAHVKLALDVANPMNSQMIKRIRNFCMCMKIP